MNFIKHIIKNHLQAVLSLGFFIVFVSTFYIFASAPLGGYTPGATLNPDCAPDSINCIVKTSNISGLPVTNPGINQGMVCVTTIGDLWVDAGPVFDCVVDVIPLTQYTLTYTAGAHGSITGSSPQTIDEGNDGTAVTAVPDSGYVFVDWSDSSVENPRQDINVIGDITVTANFAWDGCSTWATGSMTWAPLIDGNTFYLWTTNNTYTAYSYEFGGWDVGNGTNAGLVNHINNNVPTSTTTLSIIGDDVTFTSKVAGSAGNSIHLWPTATPLNAGWAISGSLPNYDLTGGVDCPL